MELIIPLLLGTALVLWILQGRPFTRRETPPVDFWQEYLQWLEEQGEDPKRADRIAKEEAEEALSFQRQLSFLLSPSKEAHENLF